MIDAASEAKEPAVEGESPGLLHGLIDEVVATYGSGEHRADVAAAKEEFFERAGAVFEDDGDLFEARMAAFLEWYVLERPLPGPGQPPVELALEAAVRAAAVGPRVRGLAHLCATHRSLFEVTAVDGHVVELEDLLRGARFAVTERRSTAGFDAGDVVEARLVWDGREVVFTKTFLFHPRDARDAIAAHIDAALGKDKPGAVDELLFTLSRLHLRWRRLGLVTAGKIYRADLRPDAGGSSG